MSRLFPTEDPPINADELEKSKQFLSAYHQAQRLQKMRERTIEGYSQVLWKAARYFNRCPADLRSEQLQSNSGLMLTRYAPTTVNEQVASLVFLYRHVPNREVEWEKIIRQRSPRSLTIFPTREEVRHIITSCRRILLRKSSAQFIT
jgi:integrase/recombinase XerD